MRKVLYSLGLIGLMVPFGIKALTGDVTVTCAKSEISKGETTTCSVKANITEGVSSISAKVDLGDNLTFVSFVADSSWQGDGDEGNIDLYTDNNKSGNFNIGTITVKAGNTPGVSTSVGLKEVILSDANFVQSDKIVTPFNIKIAAESSSTDQDDKNETPKADDNSNSDTDKKNSNDTKKNEGEPVNPKTGVRISVFSFLILGIGCVSYIILKNKNYFNKI